MKTLGLALVALVVGMVGAGGAWGTSLTSPAGTTVVVGAKIKAAAEAPHVKWDGTVTITCANSAMEGEVTNAGGSTATVVITLASMSFAECGNNTFTVVTPGMLELHATSGGDGTVTWTGGEATVLTHNILGTAHCLYKTNRTHIGTLTGSAATGGTATLDIGSAVIPESSTVPSGCNDDTLLTGNYTFTTPDYLYVN